LCGALPDPVGGYRAKPIAFERQASRERRGKVLPPRFESKGEVFRGSNVICVGKRPFLRYLILNKKRPTAWSDRPKNTPLARPDYPLFSGQCADVAAASAGLALEDMPSGLKDSTAKS
jgi:hypothetical protein